MRTLCAVGLAALCLTWAAPLSAQVPDHLKCYKVKDPQAKTTYTADLGGLVAEPSCTIKVPATMACVPATKTNVTPPPPGGGGTGTPNTFFCYKVKCPKATLPTLTGADQFGNRTVTPSAAKLVCAPVATSPRFVDNGDGTVTDHQTGLQWEKKVAGSGCPNCVDDFYAWSDSGFAPDGPALTGFLGKLNNCASPDGSSVTPAFAGHCDWRLPGITELQTIVDLSAPGCGSGSPCIDPIFGPTKVSDYWSSTSESGTPGNAWDVTFFNGNVLFIDKTTTLSVRAVRGGS
jgi:hypothetical protein